MRPATNAINSNANGVITVMNIVAGSAIISGTAEVMEPTRPADKNLIKSIKNTAGNPTKKNNMGIKNSFIASKSFTKLSPPQINYNIQYTYRQEQIFRNIITILHKLNLLTHFSLLKSYNNIRYNYG